MKQEAIESVPTPTIVAAFWGGAFVSSVGNLPPHLSLISFLAACRFLGCCWRCVFLLLDVTLLLGSANFGGGDLLPPI